MTSMKIIPVRSKCTNNHLMTKDNIYWYNNYALCKKCRRINRRVSAARIRIKLRKNADSLKIK